MQWIYKQMLFKPEICMKVHYTLFRSLDDIPNMLVLTLLGHNLYKLYHCNLRRMPWTKGEEFCITSSQLQDSIATAVRLLLI